MKQASGETLALVGLIVSMRALAAGISQEKHRHALESLMRSTYVQYIRILYAYMGARVARYLDQRSVSAGSNHARE